MGKHSELRVRCALLIEKTISDIDKDNIKDIRTALRKAYPFKSTKGYTYKVWLKEIHSQLGFKLKRSRKHRDQLELF